jgi:F-type H+-transporting ATPase subunit delta
MATISNNDIARAIYLSSKDKSGAEQSALFPKITQFLLKRRLLSQSPDILARLDKMIDEADERIVVKISSKETLHENTKKEIAHILKERYSAKKVVLIEDIDKNLLGGFKIEVNDEVIDLTIKNKVERLQEYLTKSV